MSNKYSPIVNNVLRNNLNHNTTEQLALVDEALTKAGFNPNIFSDVKMREARNEVYRREKGLRRGNIKAERKANSLTSKNKGETYRHIVKNSNDNINKSEPREKMLHATKGWRNYRSQDKG